MANKTIKVVAICCILAVVCARPSPQHPAGQYQPFPATSQAQYDLALRNWANAIILHYLYENYGYGYSTYREEAPEPRRYEYSYAQDDGHVKEETGVIENEGTDNESLAVKGSYSYVGDDGNTYNVTYTADENGFQPAGEHIPPSAGVKPKLGIPSAALASLAGGGLG